MRAVQARTTSEKKRWPNKYAYKVRKLPPIVLLVVVLQSFNHVAITRVLSAPNERASSLVLQILDAVRKSTLKEDVLLHDEDRKARDASHARGLLSQFRASLAIVLDVDICVIVVIVVIEFGARSVVAIALETSHEYRITNGRKDR